MKDYKLPEDDSENNVILQEVINEIKSIMDEVFESHVGKDVKPYKLTNEQHIGAILLGMGLGELKLEGDDFKVVTKIRTEIFWTGEKFNIAQYEN